MTSTLNSSLQIADGQQRNDKLCRGAQRKADVYASEAKSARYALGLMQSEVLAQDTCFIFQGRINGLINGMLHTLGVGEENVYKV
jgi:hypothetical protein